MIPHPLRVLRHHLSIQSTPAYTLARKRCPVVSCGKQTTARQLAQYGRCAVCQHRWGGA